MKKIDKHTANYIQDAINYFTEAHIENIKDIKSQGKNPLFSKTYFERVASRALQNLEQVTRKK
jgi:hypothetical protein